VNPDVEPRAHGAPEEMLDGAPFGFVSFADDGAITVINSTALQLLGYERDELVGRPFEKLLGVGARIFYQTHFFPLVTLHGRADEIFLLLRSKTGEAVGVLANAVRRRRGAGFANDCAFMRVSEREKFENELLRARRAAEDAQAVLREQARELEEANQMLENQAVELELQHQAMQEQALEMEVQAEELQSANDELLDRTEQLERQRAMAEEANRAKSTFLAVMSHELRTPLNAIGGYVQLLEMGIHGPVTPEQLEALSRIDRSQRHLLRLINDVLNLARIEAGRVEYHLDDVPLSEVVSGVALMVEPQLAAKEIGFSVHVGPGEVARADREKTQQIVLNLLGNATKFTPEGGRVVVDAFRRADRPGDVFLRVTDTGPGIPAEMLGSIFEPFVQVDTSHTRRGQGTGLGLAISRDLARGMGGDLHAESVVGEGSSFTLTLPRPPAGEAPAA
jgi:PAS domain S-box-containing protein